MYQQPNNNSYPMQQMPNNMTPTFTGVNGYTSTRNQSNLITNPNMQMNPNMDQTNNMMNPNYNMGQMNPNNGNYPSQQNLMQSNQQINTFNGVPQMDPYAPLNQGISAGFGQFFFNMNDPNIAKTNVPIKQDSSMHVPIIVTTLLLIGGIVGGIIVLNGSPNLGAGIGIIAGAYVIYVGISICCSDIRGYVSNLKKFDDYKKTYDKMKAGRGYFHFWIECYHYRTVRTKNGTRREKVVTHTATQDYFPRQSFDQSGDITGITDLKKYVFVNYLKRFYFTDANSSNNFEMAYNNFINRNRRDQYQNYTQTFQIQGFEPQVGFCMLGESVHSVAIFYILTLIGLALPYSCILQRAVSRYAINIVKRLTC